MEYADAKKRLLAARALLLESATTFEKVSSVHALLKGIHADLDKAIAKSEEAVSTLRKMYEGAFIELSADHLPEETEEQKKRKKFLLLFLSRWKDLKSEALRIQNELEAGESAGKSPKARSTWGKIFSFAKGPLGIVTIVAAAVVLTMKYTSVDIAIYNEGCGTMHVSTQVPISLPGLSLPKDSIPNGGSAVATIPPLTVDVDGTKPGVVTLGALTFNATFQLPSNVDDVTLNGASLLGKKQKIKLSTQKEHTLELICK